MEPAFFFCLLSVSSVLSVVHWPSVSGANERGQNNPLAAWRCGVKVRPVAPENQHSIHAYFNTSPESPDGRWILYYASRTTTGHDGEIQIRDRVTGVTKILSRDVVVEDAHRAACQQWTANGQIVVYHNVLPSGEWVVMAVDVETSRQRLLARGRQVGFGQPHGNIVPIYGPHWNPGEHRDLELVNVETGDIAKTALTADAASSRYAEPRRPTALLQRQRV